MMKPQASYRLLGLVLLLLSLSLTGCSSKSPNYSAACLKVTPPSVPPLPDSAKQTPLNTQICSPSCSEALTKERENWRQSLTIPE